MKLAQRLKVTFPKSHGVCIILAFELSPLATLHSRGGWGRLGPSMPVKEWAFCSAGDREALSGIVVSSFRHGAEAGCPLALGIQ